MGTISPKTADVVRVNLNPTVGGEKAKVRPCLVMQGDAHPLNLIILLPITEDTGKRTPKLFVPIDDARRAGLTKRSVVDCFQIRTISIERISAVLGTATEQVMSDVRQRLALLFDIGEEHIV